MFERKLTVGRQNDGREGERIMADRRSLGILGFMLGSVTAAVMLIAVIVVKHHVDGRLTFDAARLPVVAAAAQAVIR
jgi:hypothetical protein